ncbi:MAG TPA: hypothetical protein DHW79_02205 [Candidatus Cloacimonas sp.]|nr:hypothetical protein [Candidatus Cloacimonas sp.]HCX59433.1 hypothetical protein [Candidatus Cloacimonas sp.]
MLVIWFEMKISGLCQKNKQRRIPWAYNHPGPFKRELKSKIMYQELFCGQGKKPKRTDLFR